MANLKPEFHESLTHPCGVNHDEEMNICLLESHLKMSKSHANVVSFDENVSYLSTSMNLYERNKQFLFINKTAIELTGQTLAPLLKINLKMAGLCWSNNPKYCYNIPRCVSLAVVFYLISFYYSSLAD